MEFISVILMLYVLYRLIKYILELPYISEYAGKYVLITGCDTGFGHNAVLRLDKLGVNVFAACFTKDGIERLKQETSNRVKVLQLDVTKHDDIQRAYQFVRESLPDGEGLWGLVSNAGRSTNVGPSEWLTREDFNSDFDVNVYGSIDVTLTFLPLIKQSKGRIVLMSSASAFFTSHGLGSYACSKSSTEALGDLCRRAWSCFGVSVHLIEPGLFKTTLMSTANFKHYNRAWLRLDKELKEEVWGLDYYDKFAKKLCNNLIKMASDDLREVTHCIEHALFAYRPRARYIVGFSGVWMILPMSWLPEWLGDFLCVNGKNGPCKPISVH